MAGTRSWVLTAQRQSQSF